MPDYDLGRATGEIHIGADTRGATEAQAAMAATAAEAKILDRDMGQVNKQFEENRKQNISTAEQIRRHRSQVEDLRQTYERYNSDTERATRRRIEAEKAFEAAQNNANAKTNEMLRLARDVARARESEERLTQRAELAYARYQTKLASVRQELENFNAAHIQATSTLSRMRFEAERTGEALENLSSKLSSILRIVGQGGIMGIFGLGSASTTTAMGAGGISGISNLMIGAVQAVQDLSGVLALLPAVVNSAVISVGTLATAFHGVGQALGSLDDPNKFLDSLRQLSPLMQQAVSVVYSFGDAFRGVREVIQDSFVAPMLDQIQPLIYTWLPILMNTGRQVADQFGKMGSEVMRVFMTPEMQQSFSLFTTNMVRGMENMRGAIQPLLEAWSKLSDVGGSFLPRLGAAITDVANKFNNWVSQAAADGSLARWIDRALTGFTNLGNTIVNAARAIGNIMDIGDKYGDGGFLKYLRDLSLEFQQWTESSGGMQTIANFFDLIKQAGAAMHPILRLVGEGFATVGGALTRLGIQIAPAVTEFFKAVVESLHSLAPVVQQMGPSISKFLGELGKTLVEVVQSAGPELPRIFKGLTDALIQLLPILPAVTEFIVKILEHLSPGEIQGIFLAVVAVDALATAFGALSVALDINPITLVIGAIAAMVTGVIYAYNHVKGFHDAVDGLWQSLQNIGGTLSSVFSDLGSTLDNIWNGLVNGAQSWGERLIQGLMAGIKSMMGPLGQLVFDVAETIDDHWHPGSPTKKGPLSAESTEQMGANLVSGYASGIAGGTPGVTAAAASVAGSASGLSGYKFSTAGTSGRSGSGVGQHESGFSQYIDFLTNDLRQWNSIFQQAFNLVNLASNQVVQSIRIVASIWNRGDNPLTRAGGIAGPPLIANQWAPPGIPNAQAPGKPPIPALAPLGGAAPGQQSVPGVPNVGPQNTYSSAPATQPQSPAPGPGSAGGTPPGGGSAGVAAPQASRPPIAGGAAPAGLNDDQYANAQMIINGGRARGMTDEQITAALAIAADESNISSLGTNFSGGNASVGGVTGVYQQSPGWKPGDSQHNINTFLDTFQANLRAQPGANPLDVAVGIQQHGAPGAITPYQGTSGDQWYRGQVQNAMQSPVFQAAQGLLSRGGAGGWNAAVPGNGPIDGSRFAEELANRRNAPATPPFTPQPYGLPRGTNTGGYGNTEADKIFPQWVLDLGKQYNVRPSTYGTHQESDRGGERGYAPNPDRQNRGIDWVGSREDMQRFAEALLAYGGAEGSAGALEQVIYQAGPGGKRYGLGGAGNIQESYYPQSGEGSYDEHGGLDSGAHVHTRFSASVPSDLGTGPRRPPATSVGASGPSSQGRSGSSFYNDLYPPTGGNPPSRGGLGWLAPAAIGIGGALLGGIGRKTYRGFQAANDDLFEVRVQQAMLRNGGDQAAAINEVLGIKPPPGEQISGLNVLLGRDQAPITPSSGTGAVPVVPGGARPSPADLGRMNELENIARGRIEELRARGVPITSPLQGATELEMQEMVGIMEKNPDYFYRPNLPKTGLTGEPGPGLQRVGGAVTNIDPLFRSPTGWRPYDATAGQFVEPPVRLPQPTGVPPARPPASTTGSAPPSSIGGAPTGGPVVGKFGLGTTLGLSTLGAQQDQYRVDSQGRELNPETGRALTQGEKRLQQATEAIQTTTGVLPSLVIGGILGAAPTSAGDVTPFNPGPMRTGTPPAQVQGKQPSNAGQFTGVDPNQLKGPLAPGGPGPTAGLSGTDKFAQELINRRAAIGADTTNGQAASQQQVALRDQTGPRPPRPGEPGFVGPVPVVQQPKPAPTQQSTTQRPSGVGQVAGQGPLTGSEFANNGAIPTSQRLPFNAQSPLDAYSQGMAGAANVASDAFRVFNDVITNISATADITETLVRGPENTEDIVKIIQNFQTYIQTAADIASLVGDVGGLVGMAGQGDPTGGAQAVGGGISAIAGLVSAALQGVNNSITLGIDIYRQIGKYAGFIFGEFLGGDATGPLGGNVRMILNTRTNQLQTFSDSNPLNKNYLNVPAWQRTYEQQQTPASLPPQVNIYAGPGQSPREMMNESMWAISTGAGPVASVAGRE